MKNGAHAYLHGVNGTLDKYLATVPKEDWNYVSTVTRWSLLNSACIGPNLKAVKMLIANGADVCVTDPILNAIEHHQDVIVKYLIAAGANMRIVTHWPGPQGGHSGSLLDLSLYFRSMQCAMVLIASGARLSANAGYTFLHSFQAHILKLRQVVIALLRVKRAGKLHQWDKFLLKEIAWAVWATKYSL